jgi:AbiV family abortive infection protein
MAKTTPVPGLAALADFAMAAIRNARRLLDDAELLLNRGRGPSAYSLAVLAFEEAGKAWLCVIAMMVPDHVRPEWPHGDLINKHVDKLMAAHVMAHMLASAISGQDMIASLADIGENLEELARTHDKAKQRGLYVDLLDSGFWEPASVTKDEARRMVAIVGGLLDHGAYLADPEFITWVSGETQEISQIREMWWGRFFTALQQDGPDGMLASLRSLMDETGATEGLPQMLREQAQSAAAARVLARNRVQPRKLPRSQRRLR